MRTSKVAAALAVVLVSSLMGIEARPASAGSSCEKPQPRIRYTAEDVRVSLRVDLSRCHWWKGSGIDLEGDLQKGFPGEGIGAFKYCGVATWAGEGLRPPEPPRVKRCALHLRLEHLPVEAQTYQGSFTYPWRTGPQTVDFSYLCISGGTAAECRER